MATISNSYQPITNSFPLKDYNNFGNSRKNIKDSEVRDFEDTIMSILKSLVNDFSIVIEMLMLSKLVASESTVVNSILATLLSSFVRYFLGYISFKIREHIESQTFKLEFPVSSYSPSLQVIEAFLDKHKDNLNVTKYSGSRDNTLKRMMMDYGINRIDDPQETAKNQELRFNFIPNTKYVYDLNGDKINIILDFPEKNNPYILGPTENDKYSLILSCKKKGVVEKFYKSCEKYYKEEINKSMIHLVDSTNNSPGMPLGYPSNRNSKTKPLNINKNIDKLFLPGKLGNDLEYFLKEFDNILRRKEDIGMSRKIGILLSGHSGCGKTSSVFAMSKELTMPIYKVQPPIDLTLESGLNSIPERSIILIDDFDSSYFAEEENSSDPSQRIQPMMPPIMSPILQPMEPPSIGSGEGCPPMSQVDPMMMENMRKQMKKEIEEKMSLDAKEKSFENERKERIKMQKRNLLNKLLGIFDGYYGLKDCILVLTTNRPDQIEPELLRPGRIDYHFDFGRSLSRDQIISSFNRFYGDKHNYDQEYLNMKLDAILEKKKTMANVMSCIATFEDYTKAVDALCE